MPFAAPFQFRTIKKYGSVQVTPCKSSLQQRNAQIPSSMWSQQPRVSSSNFRVNWRYAFQGCWAFLQSYRSYRRQRWQRIQDLLSPVLGCETILLSSEIDCQSDNLQVKSHKWSPDFWEILWIHSWLHWKLSCGQRCESSTLSFESFTQYGYKNNNI